MVAMRLPFLRKAKPGAEPLVVAMSGARLGDSVLFAGHAAPLVLPLAGRTGLSGRCLVVGPQALTSSLESAATMEGLLVETSEVFPSDRSFELAVVEAVGDWAASASSARASVRSGGRIIVVSVSPREGLLARLTASVPEVPPESIVTTLKNAGWQRVRSIGAREGLAFVEAFA